MQFDHEKLDVFGVALDFVISADELSRAATRGDGHGELADQLRRASLSILLNLAEGAGEYAAREKARFWVRRAPRSCGLSRCSFASSWRRNSGSTRVGWWLRVADARIYKAPGGRDGGRLVVPG